MEVTFYGHACFSVNIEGRKILFDPFITPNELANNIDINTIEADYIFISHGHEDHVADVEKIAKKTNAIIVSNFEIVSWFNSKGLSNSHPMNHGGSWNFDFGKVKYVNAVHSSTLPDGSIGGNPGGFVIESKAGNFYFAGDTALNMDMKLIPLFTKLDFAIFPIGDNFTMGIQEAIVAADFVKVNKVMGVHYDTFGYIKIDSQEAINSFKKNNLTLLLPEIGETIEI
ncbi:MAG: metal-dependent hydrolase [Flavobacteriales bacterium]|jgi:L-ascorbate metabolism protein UlaG (beta-lactamase superfamily)|nr:metal-dependent hydrolase [Flavobacteriales bacterium]